MSRYKSRGDAILYTWDYFYCANAPAPGDAKTWSTIERALGRVRESEYYASERNAQDVRYRAARRMRDALRVALKQIELLARPPERWVVSELEALRSYYEMLVPQLSMDSSTQLLH